MIKKGCDYHGLNVKQSTVYKHQTYRNQWSKVFQQ